MKIEQILQLVESVSSSTLTEFKYEEDGVKLSLKKTTEGQFQTVPVIQTQAVQAVQPVQAIPTETGETPAADKVIDGKVMKSPLVGTFYAAPSENAEPFVKVGDSVKEGQVLAIVEAMKLMNEIDSDFSGIVAEILVENGAPVEYGQPLFVIKGV
ncbi:acetyl-CoA carboxylase biotin carboxyl carrier protein [Faecalicatena contorta]|uniref:Biotin carboxyl carrier protein of acetyl-CoA carboxylase n=1 Tax=Faecalicatena contorta TaxID=39482 RepID=A0A315ZWX9_9FIRM|nr:acetyl-CoA carboxylase biotin carboxyl carrier protein [Faecalicatena contorta]PWJ49378.1 acetyl-CoA carboxylase biotin carboxyl carrier protein [Faecalicatena contorta]SUQ14622.1 acetyl-CoA carboxylase biotin carboxyl carrier protein [Faecalicatena contorta]